jgi:hypothetical protein
MTLFYNFIVNNRNLIRDLKEALNNDTVLNALSQAIHYEDKVVDGLKNLILSDNNTVEFIFEIVQYKSIINVIFIMIRNAEKGYNAMIDIPNLMSAINDLGQRYYDNFLEIVINTLKKETTFEVY